MSHPDDVPGLGLEVVAIVFLLVVLAVVIAS